MKLTNINKYDIICALLRSVITLEKNIRELDLSPAAYILLISNGIKTISSLIAYSKEELLSLTMSSKKYAKRSSIEKLVDEITDKLDLYDLQLETKTDRVRTQAFPLPSW